MIKNKNNGAIDFIFYTLFIVILCSIFLLKVWLKNEINETQWEMKKLNSSLGLGDLVPEVDDGGTGSGFFPLVNISNPAGSETLRFGTLGLNSIVLMGLLGPELKSGTNPKFPDPFGVSNEMLLVPVSKERFKSDIQCPLVEIIV